MINWVANLHNWCYFICCRNVRREVIMEFRVVLYYFVPFFFLHNVKQWQWISNLICFYCGRQGKFFFSSILWEQDWIFEYFRRNILGNHFWGQMFYFDLPSVFLAMSILRAPHAFDVLRVNCYGQNVNNCGPFNNELEWANKYFWEYFFFLIIWIGISSSE